MSLQPLLKMFSQGDGSLDEAIVGGVYGCLAVTALQLYALHKGQEFSAVGFGTALGAIWSGSTVLMKFRKTPPTEPTP